MARLLAALTVVLMLTLTACKNPHLTTTGTPKGIAERIDCIAGTPEAIMGCVERAVAGSGGYRITITGQNLVLPEWGGIDSGTIDVGTDGTVVRGDVERTGDGPYSLVSLGGETFFQRGTCDHMARVPGGGAAVVTPFLLGTSGALSRATNVRFGGTAYKDFIAVRANVEDLGDVLIQLDTSTYLPFRLVKEPGPNGGSQFQWLFSDWGQAPSVSRPAGTPPDQGPGGNPC